MAADNDDDLNALGEVIENITALADQLQAGALPQGARPLPEMDYLDRLDREQDIHLKRMYARGLFFILGLQLVIADCLVYLYAGIGKGWDVPSDVINVWLGATVVQLIGVVLVVTRYLFPHRDA